jgi:hypothetical protein
VEMYAQGFEGNTVLIQGYSDLGYIDAQTNVYQKSEIPIWNMDYEEYCSKEDGHMLVSPPVSCAEEY